MQSQSPGPEGSLALTFFNDFEARAVEGRERIVPRRRRDARSDRGRRRLLHATAPCQASPCRCSGSTGWACASSTAIAYGRTSGHLSISTTSSRTRSWRRFLGPETGPQAETHAPVGEDDYDFRGERDGAGEAAADASSRAILRRFFAVIREHTFEGLFCDPVYGGNRNAAGWRLVGFPGAHWATRRSR